MTNTSSLMDSDVKEDGSLGLLHAQLSRVLALTIPGTAATVSSITARQPHRFCKHEQGHCKELNKKSEFYWSLIFKHVLILSRYR